MLHLHEGNLNLKATTGELIMVIQFVHLIKSGKWYIESKKI